MRWVLPPDDWNDRGAASLIACLASVLETGPEAIDLEPYDVDPGSGRLRGWLGERGLGLVPVADPDAFAWPGPWIAAVPDDADTRSVRWVVAFGSPAPAGIIWDPLRPTRPDGPAEGLLAGFVVAALVPGLPTPPGASIAEPGSVTAIVLAPDAGAPAVEVARARAVAGRGLEGDRYAVGRGTFSRGAGYGRELTLVEEELLGAAIVDGAPITPVQARRNVAVRGIVLDSLIGRRFRIGEVQCVGRRRCEPCAHLQRLGPPGVLRALVHRGGLRADILTDGEIAVGDDVVVLP